MLSSKKFYLLGKIVKNAKWWSKSNLPLSQTAKFYPFLKGLKKIIVHLLSTFWQKTQQKTQNGDSVVGLGFRGWSPPPPYFHTDSAPLPYFSSHYVLGPLSAHLWVDPCRTPPRPNQQPLWYYPSSVFSYTASYWPRMRALWGLADGTSHTWGGFRVRASCTSREGLG